MNTPNNTHSNINSNVLSDSTHALIESNIALSHQMFNNFLLKNENKNHSLEEIKEIVSIACKLISAVNRYKSTCQKPKESSPKKDILSPKLPNAISLPKTIPTSPKLEELHSSPQTSTIVDINSTINLDPSSSEFIDSIADIPMLPNEEPSIGSNSPATLFKSNLNPLSKFTSKSKNKSRLKSKHRR